MPYTIGQVMCSKAGRDKETFMVITATDGDALLLADGKHRPLERPKRKNIKHLSATAHVLTQEQYKTNKALRHALNDLFGAASRKGDE